LSVTGLVLNVAVRYHGTAYTTEHNLQKGPVSLKMNNPLWVHYHSHI